MLYIIGLGLGDEKDITVRGLEIVKKCERVYLEAYTAVLGIGVERLEKFYGRPVLIADRTCVEQKSDVILHGAEKADVALLVVGDPLAATTHHDLMMRASDAGIPVNVVHNASIMNAVACCGLQLYSFGQTVSIPYFDGNWRPDSFYDKIKANMSIGNHTLCLLDIKVKEQTKENLAKGLDIFEPPRFMSVTEAIKQLLEVEDARGEGVCTRDKWAIGLARVGQETQQVISGTLEELLNIDFGGPLHSLVLAGPSLHSFEETALFYHHWDEKNRKERLAAFQSAKEAARLEAIQKNLREMQLRAAEAAAARKKALEAAGKPPTSGPGRVPVRPVRRFNYVPPRRQTDTDSDEENDAAATATAAAAKRAEAAVSSSSDSEDSDSD